MGRKASVLGLAMLMALLLVRGQGLADKQPGTHTHGDKAPQGATAGDHGQPMEGHTHQHDTWEAPPPEYASTRSTRWDDPAAVARGGPLFQTYCMVCHGTDGKGTGPAAAGPRRWANSVTDRAGVSPSGRKVAFKTSNRT